MTEQKSILTAPSILEYTSSTEMVRLFRKSFVLGIWYFLTAHLPRRLPRDLAEWEKFRFILMTYFGVLDREISWMAVSSHVSSTPAGVMYRSYQYFANVAVRQLMVNDAARETNQKFAVSLQAKLKVAIDKENARHAAQEKANGEAQAAGGEACPPDAEAH